MKDIWAIRINLQLGKRIRDLAMFNLAIDSKLRGCDLVNLRVRDVSHGSQIINLALTVRQPDHDLETTRNLVFRHVDARSMNRHMRLLILEAC